MLYPGTGDLIIKEGRHPCLEVQEEITFIPNDTELHRGVTRIVRFPVTTQLTYFVP